ncbi:MAG: AraC family transcriptional regulator [Oscillospiraceae bacterium]|nr:AraC family transcriptional regulator [Oscillospiraceae bacterium]
MCRYTVEFNRDDWWDMERFHFHDHYEILLSLTGSGRFWADRNGFDMRRGSLILLPPNVLHRSCASPDALYRRSVLRFSPEYARRVSSSVTDLTSCFRANGSLHQLDEGEINSVSALYQRCAGPFEGFGADLRADAAFVGLMLAVCELTDRMAAESSKGGRDMERLEPALLYIHEHLADPLTLSDIAKQVFLSKNYLCALFKRITGFSVGEYIVNRRILLAQRYLREGVYVQRAGELSGFSNNSHFIRTFHSTAGCSPGQYAKRYRQHADPAAGGGEAVRQL